MKYVDLFAGIGGFHYGIEQAYRAIQESQQEIWQHETSIRHQGNIHLPISLDGDGRGIRPVCVYSNEWDKYANSVYRRHYGECDNRDIRTVKVSEIPDFDLLCGGFPCQAFSVAGKRGGFDDTRGTLFFEVARILKEKQPRLLVLENVKGLLSHDHGRTFKVILTTLTELGYDVQWQVLNSKNFGVPQNRERVYIVGHLRGTPRPQVFPITNPDRQDTKTRTHEQSGTEKFIKTRHLSQNGTLISDSITLQATELPHIIQKSPDWRSEGKLREFTKNSPTIRAEMGDNHPMVTEGAKIRRLTPTECMRLQGFPDDWCDLGVSGETISDSQKYKMAGNAVTTNVVTEVVRKLL